MDKCTLCVVKSGTEKVDKCTLCVVGNERDGEGGHVYFVCVGKEQDGEGG